MSTTAVAESLTLVRARLAALTSELKRPPNAVRLVAVSKTHPAEVVRQAYDAGQRRFGENYVQELVDKAPVMPPDVQWHFIGHLQSNKVKQLVDGVPNLACVESLASKKTATMLDKRWGDAKRERALEVMVQVNTSGEDSKDGVEPSECLELVSFVVDTCPHLSFVGLMTIGRLGDSTPECFETLAGLRDALLTNPELSGKLPPKEAFQLSMGMSGDYELAVRCGSTSVRVGSTIFGKRDVKPVRVREAPPGASGEGGGGGGGGESGPPPKSSSS